MSLGVEQHARRNGRRVRPLRLGTLTLLWLCLMGGMVLTLPALASYAGRRLDSAAPSDPRSLFIYVEVGALGAAAIGLAWIACISTLLLACAVLRTGQRAWFTGERILRAVSPRFVRNMLATGLGLGMSAMTLMPASAAPESDPFEVNLSWSAETVEEQDANLKVAANAQKQEAPAPADEISSPAVSDAETVTVVAGDSLWKIAQRHLPDSASNAEVDAAWRQWYDLNAEVIGANPDLIHPGIELVAPN